MFVVCKNCGNALGNEQATCPFCGAFIHKDQVSAFKEMKKEKEKDLRPKLVSERYGMDSILYEQKKMQTNGRLIAILGICAVLVVIFLILVLVMF